MLAVSTATADETHLESPPRRSSRTKRFATAVVAAAVIASLSPTVRAHVAGPFASAFGYAFWWAFRATLIAVIPASLLVITQRRERQATAAGIGGAVRAAVHPAKAK
jgi:hypothetical protein